MTADGQDVSITLPITFSTIYTIQNNLQTTTWGVNSAAVTETAVSWVGGLIYSYSSTNIVIRRTGVNSTNLILIYGI